jgi:hypothetical protein
MVATVRSEFMENSMWQIDYTAIISALLTINTLNIKQTNKASWV